VGGLARVEEWGKAAANDQWVKEEEIIPFDSLTLCVDVVD
jgi:hypothetical protein